jgi:hypothetical protein
MSLTKVAGTRFIARYPQDVAGCVRRQCASPLGIDQPEIERREPTISFGETMALRRR